MTAMSPRRRLPSWLLAILALAEMSWATPVKCSVGKLPIFEGSLPNFNVPHLVDNGRVHYKCRPGFKPLNENASYVTCHEGSWIPKKDFCAKKYCEQPPNIINGFHNGSATIYALGTIIHYHCRKNFSLIGASSIVCRAGENLKGVWKGEPPKCKENDPVSCNNPVVQHGIMITEHKKPYIHGSNVKFQCKIGYFMIGNYLIQCENITWVPKVPSCKKISPDKCGAPLIPNGNIEPLQPQYKTGKAVVISCNQNYSFIDDTVIMTTQCLGYNLWNPPAQLCLPKTSPDNFQLFINHGKIVNGKKKYYKPGDEVEIACHGGYILRGSAKIKYIGGNKWLPNVPECHLSMFLKIVIAGCLLPVWILLAKILYQMYEKERERRENQRRMKRKEVQTQQS